MISNTNRLIILTQTMVSQGLRPGLNPGPGELRQADWTGLFILKNSYV
jgi:hypothetical protein